MANPYFTRACTSWNQWFISADGSPSVEDDFTNPQFGQIVGAMNARIMQFEVKFHF